MLNYQFYTAKINESNLAVFHSTEYFIFLFLLDNDNDMSDWNHYAICNEFIKIYSKVDKVKVEIVKLHFVYQLIILRLVMIVSFLLWLVPATLDTVVQVTNSIAVNRIAQGEEFSNPF